MRTETMSYALLSVAGVSTGAAEAISPRRLARDQQLSEADVEAQ